MLRNYIKTALRSLFRKPFFTIINLLGLTAGMAASLIIFMYVSKEYSYDRFHEDADRIYRIRLDRYNEGELAEQMATSCNALGGVLEEEFPEVEAQVRLSNYQLDGVVEYGDFQYRANNAFFASKDYFSIFSYNLLQGDPATALANPNSIVLSESLAKKYFKEEDPMGKLLIFNGLPLFKVTGVYADPPVNSHLKPEMLISLKTMMQRYGRWVDESWWMDITLTYVKLAKGTDPEVFSQKLIDLKERKVGEELKKRNHEMVFHLQPLRSIHLYSNYPQEAEANGNGKIVNFLTGIAFIILIIAWINYINLSTAQSLERSKEVALRKISGSSRSKLIYQYLSESLIINLLAAGITILIVYLAYPLFNKFVGIQIDLSLWQKGWFWILFAIVIVGGAIISGSYPAFVLSSFKPTAVLKAKKNSGHKGGYMRKVLIVFQLAITFILLFSTIMITRQLDHLRKQDLGINIERALIVKGPAAVDSTWYSRYTSFRTELLKTPEIKNVCGGFFVPGDEIWFTNGYIKQMKNADNQSQTLSVVHVDENYLPFFGSKFLAGRNFYGVVEGEQLSHIINRKAMELLGYESPEDAIQDQLHLPNWHRTKPIVGVIENYHHESFKEHVPPMIFSYFPRARWLKKYAIRMQTDNYEAGIQKVEELWNQFFPGNLFEYSFLEDDFAQQYQSDQQFGRIFGLFAVLAIIITCMGLFALALHYTLQRTFDLAIHKVNGARLHHIFLLLSREYLVLFIISLFIGIPLSLTAMEQWLNNYASRISLSPGMIIIPFTIMLLIICMTVIYQVIRSSRVNTAKMLKYE